MFPVYISDHVFNDIYVGVNYLIIFHSRGTKNERFKD